ncbi:RhoGAP-domain-containing protein [Anaeromyces robustus]|uniref:RhoGAP-domain-containing protein n=1 Tax=Anaeromyces robustus TaxID=1754192 RepID=A0A1Y1WSU0_9FUNG|nr:RhoGAP-domain-containing protein [Anaeromyces robustus]|eukprot:ORX76522.1 RhoGAP-domain-containing protein [Anaeromyces robustus]
MNDINNTKPNTNNTKSNTSNTKPNSNNSNTKAVTKSKTGEKEKTSKICISCGKVIKGQFVRALGEIYHLDCFRCIDCDEICVSKFFPFKEDGITRPLCETDYFRRLDLICAKCGGALRGPHINALNKKYHLDHFTCTVCNVVFQPNASYYEHNGNIYCQNHYSALFAQRCGGCHTPVLRQLIEVNKNTDTQEQWHPECYMIYKSWNVKLVLENELPKDPIEPKDFNAEIEKQKLVEEKIARIWSILSAFEESSAECMAEILSYVSDNLYLNGIEQAGNFVCHVDVLFSGIDEIEANLKKFNDKTGLQHTKEPKLLAKRIVNFFSLLTHKNSIPRQDTTHEFLTLVTTLAHTLKILIRSALRGALKLENVYGVKTALDSFLAKFLTLGEMQSELRQQQLMSSSEYNIQSEYCPLCHKSVEEECIKLNDSRWHSNCFYCQTCKKNLYETYETEARMDPTNKKIYCKNCSPPNCIDHGFVHVTQLEQYTFLLKFALKRLYIINMKNENIENNNNNNAITDGEEPVSSSLKQQSNKLKKIPPRNTPEQRQARLEDSMQYHSIDTLHDIAGDDDPHRGARRPSNNPARYESYHHSNNESDKYYYPPQPQPIDPNNNPLINSPIKKSYSYEQSLNENVGMKNPTKRSSREMLTKSPEGLKPTIPPPPFPPKQSFNNLHRSHSNGAGVYPVNSPVSPLQNPGIPPRSPNIRLSHSRSRSPSGNLRITNNLNHIPITNANDNGMNNLSKSFPGSSLSNSNGSLYTSNSMINGTGIRYYSELSAYELITVKHMAINTLKENLDSSLSLDLSSLIEDRKLKLWEKVFVSFKSNQKKTKPKDGTFNVPLDILVDRYGVNSDIGLSPGTVNIPVFIEKIIRSLRTKDLTIEGIFRKNGNIRRLKTLTELLDQNPENINFSEDNSIQLAALLKKFLRELPEPLLTFKLHKVFIQSQKQEDENRRFKIIQSACTLLPKCNRDLLEVLLIFLKEVASYSDKNKMDADNLATVIAPTICYSKSKDPVKDDSFLAIEAVKMMILNQDKLWIVPYDINNIIKPDNQNNINIKDLKKKNDNLIKAHSSNDLRVANIEDDYNYPIVNADSGVIHPGSAEKLDIF